MSYWARSICSFSLASPYPGLTVMAASSRKIIYLTTAILIGIWFASPISPYNLAMSSLANSCCIFQRPSVSSTAINTAATACLHSSNLLSMT